MFMEQTDVMEDSGIESDQKCGRNTSAENQVEFKPGKNTAVIKPMRHTSDLQRKLEKQRDHVRKSSQNQAIDTQPRKSNILNRSRLKVPTKHTPVPENQHETQQLLVAIPTDSEEDEFDIPLSRSNHDIAEQLIKDGYNLDLQSDNEDLDLIPPKVYGEQCMCCQPQNTCQIQ